MVRYKSSLNADASREALNIENFIVQKFSQEIVKLISTTKVQKQSAMIGKTNQTCLKSQRTILKKTIILRFVCKYEKQKKAKRKRVLTEQRFNYLGNQVLDTI